MILMPFSLRFAAVALRSTFDLQNMRPLESLYSVQCKSEQSQHSVSSGVSKRYHFPGSH